jgi:abortive infection Abi-like protein
MRNKPRRDSLRELLESFQKLSIGLATGSNITYEAWEGARVELVTQPELLRVIPEWVTTCRSGAQYWQFIKANAATYAERRQFIWSTLGPVFELIEKGSTQPTARTLEPLLDACTAESVREGWERAQARRDSDPEGAITAARSLLESTCKQLLETLNVEYVENEDLPQLYTKLASAMALGPQSHKEQVFKQILSGCFSVVNGLAALRNAFGDAHGKGATTPKPSIRHADLAVNLSGTISAFLLATYEERFKVKP